MSGKTLSEVVNAHPFPDYQDWWKLDNDFVMFMSDAIGSEWRALKQQSGDLEPAERYVEEYHRVVFGRSVSGSLVADFINHNHRREYYSGEFDALSYAFYRSAFELIAAHSGAYADPLEIERRRFTERVGARFFSRLEDHLQLDLPSVLDTRADLARLNTCIRQVGEFLTVQGYLRDHFAFTFAVHVNHAGERIDQDEGDLLTNLKVNGTAYALYEMGYPVILPSAVYLYQTMGEAQHHSSRTIEELFKRVGYDAYETDDFDPSQSPSDLVVELWQIRTPN